MTNKTEDIKHKYFFGDNSLGINNKTISKKLRLYLIKTLNLKNYNNYCLNIDNWFEKKKAFEIFINNKKTQKLIGKKFITSILDKIDNVLFENAEKETSLLYERFYNFEGKKKASNILIVYGYLKTLQFKKKEARQKFNQAFKLDKSNIYALICMADIQCDLKKTDKALSIYKKIANFYIKKKKNKLKLAIIYKKMANAWHSLGDNKNAEKLYEKVNTLKNNNSISSDMAKLAFFSYSMKKHLKASSLLKKAIKIEQKKETMYNPNIAKYLISLGDICRKQDKNKKALSYYEKAFSINKRIYGFKNRHTVKTLNKLASSFKKAKDYKKSLMIYEKTNKIEEKVYGATHYRTAINLNNIASVWSSLNGFSKANDLYDKAENILIKNFGALHPNTKKISRNKENLERKWKKAVEREKIIKTHY